MRTLKSKALARLPLTYAEVEDVYENVGECSRNQIAAVCESHERLRMESQGLERLNAELESTADKLSDVWIHLDAFARGKPFTPEMARSILRHQKAPGWKN